MVQSKPLRPEWLPAVALSSLLALAMLLWSPPVGDLAAQVFRTELFKQAGLAIWNGSWYGGHYTLTYSVLFPPLAALLGPQVVGMLAVVASSYLFDRLVRDRWGVEARWATLWFAAGVVTLLADGQLTFALGVAFGLATLRCLQLERSSLTLLAAAACPLASPVAGVFLAGVLIVGAVEPGRRPRMLPIAAGAIALFITVAPNIAFPEAGHFPFVSSSYIAIPLWCAGALLLTQGVRSEERQLRRVIVGYLLASTLIWLTPNALGGNAVRLGALFGGPVLAAVLLSRRPRPAVPAWLFVPVLALAIAGSLYWQLTASVTQIARSVGDPSTTSAYFHPAARWLRAHGGAGARIEVPPTANHWESAYLAPKFELARGWLRQLDTTRDDLFYGDDETLTALATAPGCGPTRSPMSPCRTRRSTTPPRKSAGSSSADPRTSTCASAPSTGASTRSATRSRSSPRSAPRPPRPAGSAAKASPSTSSAPASSSSASPSPPTGRSRAAPVASSAAATGPSPAPPIPASSASPPTSLSAAPGTQSPARRRPVSARPRASPAPRSPRAPRAGLPPARGVWNKACGRRRR